MESWAELLNLLILLVAAFTLGWLAESLKQSAIVGYLIAGMLVGPNALGWVSSREEVIFIAELGVTLLLFSIGLEFSFRRLVKLGPITYLGGTAQVVFTALAGYAVAAALGLGWTQALALGMMVSLSSTACVIRLLVDETQLESIYGRNCLGILLLQDLAVVILIIITIALGGESSPAKSFMLLGRTLVFGLGMFAAFFLILNRLIPRLLTLRSISKNRELPILLAVVIVLSSAWASHSSGLSPSFGAFLAGLLLAESPFATQIRADIASLRTLLVTLFFAAIGMLVNPGWIWQNLPSVGLVLALLLIVKPLVIHLITRLLGYTSGMSLATGVCLAQMGEFSFVLAGVALTSGVIGKDLFRLIVSVTVLSLLVTPYLVRSAPRLARWAESFPHLRRASIRSRAAEETLESKKSPASGMGPILIIGFGPAGQRLAEALLPHCGEQLEVLDINPSNADWAESLGLSFHIGDARQREVLEHLHIHQAEAVVITLPDPDAVRHIIHLCRSLAPEVRIFVRSRYHIYKWEFFLAGAETVIDEEAQVGLKLAEEVLGKLGKSSML